MKEKLLRQLKSMSKLTLFGFLVQTMFFSAIFAEGGKAQSKSIEEVYISISFDNIQLKDAFKEISRKTDFLFSYDKNVIDEKLQVSADFRNTSLADLLRHISKEAKLKFKRINENIYVTRKSNSTEETVSEQLSYQAKTISGQVVSAEDDEGIPGVNIIVEGTATGTVTDIDGNYSLDVPENATLSFSSVGFITTNIAVGNQSVINVKLMPDITQLSEIVVIGYGEREKKDLTGAISSMQSKDIEKSTAMTAELAMQGRMTGVRVTNNSGAPNARPTINIRGVGTFNNASPLYVIDGVLVEEFGEGQGGRNGDLRGTINIWTLVDPDDIESISVLKDASAAAIYGSRAANGVILITTKKGKAGDAKINYSGYFGVQNIPNFNLLDVSDYTKLIQEQYANDPASAGLMDPVYDPSSPLYLGNMPTIDHQAALSNKNAAIQNHNISVSGGSDRSTYFVSAGYQSQESALIQNNLDRYSISTNVNSKIGKMWEIGLNIRGAYEEALDNTRSSLNEQAINTPPWQPIYEDGDPALLGYATVMDTTLTKNINHPSWGGTSTDPHEPLYNVSNIERWGPSTHMNRFGEQQMKFLEYQLYRAISRAYLQLEPLKGLKIKGTASLDWMYNRRNSFNDINSTLFSITPTNPWTVGDGTSAGTYEERHSRQYTLQMDFSINYNRSFGDHNIDILFNAMDQYWQWENITGSTEMLMNNDRDRLWISGAPEYVRSFNGKDRKQRIGYLGRASYNYASKYYLDVSLRRDASSGFAPDYRWGTFPSVSAAWRISSESFMDGLTWINDMKLRGGWGQLGNDKNSGSFAYLSLVGTTPTTSLGSGPGNGVGSSNWGYRLPSFPVKDLTWEVAETANAAVDAILFNNKLNVTIEWYSRTMRDILQISALPPSVGNEWQPTLNIATVKNTGWEFELGYNGNVGDFTYQVSGNLSTVKNEVIEVFNDQPFGGETNRIEVGYPLFYLWGWETEGLFQNQNEVDAYQAVTTDQLAASQSPGDLYFKDINGAWDDEKKAYIPNPDSIVNANDRTYLGKTIPGFTYGVSISAQWRGFDINALFYGEGDVSRYNWARRGGENMLSNGNNQWTTISGRWTGEGTSTTMPRAVIADPASNARFSDRWIESGAFFRLNNWQFGYSLPKVWMDQTDWIERFRIYVGGQNNFTITKWSGIDIANDGFPLPRTFLFGIQATF